MRASAEDMVNGRCDGIRGRVEGAARSEGDDKEGDRGRTMAEDIQVDGEKMGERTRLWVRNGCGKGAGHATGNEWMVGKGEP